MLKLFPVVVTAIWLFPVRSQQPPESILSHELGASDLFGYAWFDHLADATPFCNRQASGVPPLVRSAEAIGVAETCVAPFRGEY